MIWPKVYEVPIREAPVLTLCFSSTGDGKYSADKKIYNYSTDFNITVQEFNMLTESKTKITLRKGENIMENSISKPIFYMEELRTKYDGACYMITAEFDRKEIDAINTQWNLRSQSFTSLMADLHKDINRDSSFSRCIIGTFP